MKFEEAQQNMNFSYFGGGTVVLVSGLAEVIFSLVIFNQSKGLILKSSKRERLPV